MRRRIRPSDGFDSRAVESFNWASSDAFTETFFGEPVFGSTDEARQAWPRCRRAVWASTTRLRLPRAAIVFDEMSFDSEWEIRFGFCHKAFPLDRVLAAVARDRVALEAFVRREPKGAREITDFLAIFREDLAMIDRQAHELATTRGDREYPGHAWSGARYDRTAGSDEAA